MLLLSLALGCTTDWDCELLGSCTAGACACKPGWRGASCGELDLRPLASQAAARVYPDAHNDTFSWGFSAALDPTTGLYHAAVNVGCCGVSPHTPYPAVDAECGVTVDGTLTAHVQSRQPDRGFELVGVFVGPTAFNPHLIRAPNGTWILYFRVNDMRDYAACRGTGPRTNSSLLRPYVDPAVLRPGGDEGPGANMYVAWADDIGGPWRARRVDIRGMGRLHISNPSVALLPGGTAMLAYRFNPAHGEQNGVATAPSFLGPFASSANITKASGNDEDPFIWSERDGTLHLLYHNGPRGLHAFSRDGLAWGKSPTGAAAFTLQLTVSGGAPPLLLSRRERPDLLFDAEGRPRHLYNGAQAPSPRRAYSIVQGVGAY